MSQPLSLLELVETFQNLLVSYATGGDANGAEFEQLREMLVNHPTLADKMPRFVRTCRDLRQFWSFIKKQSPSYQGRREFLWDAFRPIMEHLEGPSKTPADETIAAALSKLDATHVQQAWHKALQRRSEDPAGAITAARTLLESVCKLILDESGVRYEDGLDLPRLYRLTTKNLQLGPNEQTEGIFRQIFGGCQSVVEGLGALRNRLSDAHGKGKQVVGPEPRHAELAVNLAGAMATFLVAAWEARKGQAS